MCMHNVSTFVTTVYRYKVKIQLGDTPLSLQLDLYSLSDKFKAIIDHDDVKNWWWISKATAESEGVRYIMFI